MRSFSDVLIISIGAIFGANSRWLISRWAAKFIGPIFPFGTLFINLSGSFIVGFFMIWSTRAGAPGSAVAIADCGGVLRRVHNIFQLRLRNHGVLRTRPMDDDDS